MGSSGYGSVKFIENIVLGKTIDVYNRGKMSRNFTYIDDIVSGTITVLDANLPCTVMNIGGDKEERSASVYRSDGGMCRKKGEEESHADATGRCEEYRRQYQETSQAWLTPTTHIEEGVKNFVAWYREYYKV